MKLSDLGHYYYMNYFILHLINSWCISEKAMKSSYKNDRRKNTMKKNLFLSAIIFLVAGVLIACGGGTGKPSKGGQTIDVALWDENVKEIVDESIERFNEKHPDVKVNVTYTPFKDYWTKLKTGLNGGSGPDLFWMNGPNFNDYVDNGLIAEVEDTLAKGNVTKDEITSAILELYSKDDKLYGLPYFSDMVALYYNKALFDEKGIPYPDDTWDWSKVEEVGKELTDKENNIYGFGSAFSDQQGFYNYIPQNGGFILNEDKTASGYNTPEAIAALEWQYKFMTEGISPTAQEQVETELIQLFSSGRLAIWPALSVRAGQLYESLGDDLGVTVLPKGKERATVVHGISWAINAKSKEDEIIQDLALELAGKASQKQLSEAGFGIPTFIDQQDTWIDSIKELDLAPLIESMKNDGVAYPVSKNTAEWQKVQNDEIQKAFFGEQTIEEAVKKIDEAMNKILTE